jgi:hypothetical protein
MTDSQELAVIEPQAPLALFGTTDPLQVIATAAKVATALAEVVNERKLYAIVNGKKFPTVEAWTLLGSMLGVFPITEWSRPLVNEEGVVRGYEARVIARTLGGRTVGAGEAMCVRGESKTWHAGAQEFALRSMAQTRATSKALRGPLDFVFKLAGFQPTPAEEMTDASTAAVDQDGVISQPSAESVDALKGAQSGHSAPPSSGPAPVTGVEAAQSGGRAEPNRPAGPRAKRGNVVTAPQGAPRADPDATATAVPVNTPAAPPQTPATAPAVRGGFSYRDHGKQELLSNAQPLDAPLDGEEEYLDSLRMQAREVAAIVVHLRIKLTNRKNAEEIALGTKAELALTPLTPTPQSDESLTAFVANTYSKTLAELTEAELDGTDDKPGVLRTLSGIVDRIEKSGVKVG